MEDLKDFNAEQVRSFFSKAPAWIAEGRSSPDAGDDCLSALFKLRSRQIELIRALDALRFYIALRVPEVKDEDNAGVNVQTQVSKTLTSLIGELTGNATPSDPHHSRAITGAVIGAAHTGTADEYLSSRAKLETETVSECRGKDAGGAAPSAVKRLKLLDDTTAEKVAAGWLLTAQISAVAANLFKQNRDKIDNPRRDDARHMMMM